jgi:rubrerythrin
MGEKNQMKYKSGVDEKKIAKIWDTYHTLQGNTNDLLRDEGINEKKVNWLNKSFNDLNKELLSISEKDKENNKFCNKINQMIKEEENAQDDYFELIGYKPEIDVSIESISKDEKKHHDMLKRLKILYCD